MINHGQSQRHGISARKQIPTKWEQTSFHSVHHTLIWHSGNSVDIVSMSSVLFLFQSYLAAFSARASVGVCFIKAFLVVYLLHHSYFCHFLLFSRFKSILLLLHYLLSLCERYADEPGLVISWRVPSIHPAHNFTIGFVPLGRKCSSKLLHDKASLTYHKTIHIQHAQMERIFLGG